MAVGACSAQRAVARRLCAPWASRSDPSGLCRAEAFGNSFEDSVSFRFPSPQSLGVSRSSGNSAHCRMALFAVLTVTRASMIRTQAKAASEDVEWAQGGDDDDIDRI